jgi:hypothetical protein
LVLVQMQLVPRLLWLTLRMLLFTTAGGPAGSTLAAELLDPHWQSLVECYKSRRKPRQPWNKDNQGNQGC